MVTAPAAGIYWPNLATTVSGDFVNLADGTIPMCGTENSNASPTYGNSTLLVVEGVYTPTTTLDESGINPAAGVVGANFWRIQKIDTSTRSALINCMRFAPLRVCLLISSQQPSPTNKECYRRSYTNG